MIPSSDALPTSAQRQQGPFVLALRAGQGSFATAVKRKECGKNHRVEEQQRDRIFDDLRGIIKGELLFDELSRALYSTDASIFQVQPLGVIVPRDEEDVQALVRYAAEHQVPLIPRGAGSGVAGEALGRGLIVDLSQNFRAIGEIGSETIRVQAGVTWQQLNSRLAPLGRRFAPDPASGAQCTVGGMLATNASGSHVLRHGYTRDHVAAIRLVLDSGDAVWTGREPRQPPAGAAAGHFQDIVGTLATLLEQNTATIAAALPRTPYNRCGYLVHDVLADGHLDMARLLVGSEGTLALFTETVLRTVPLPGGKALVMLGFDRLETALKASQQALLTRPAACELLDRRLLSLARGSDLGRLSSLLLQGLEAILLVEYETDTAAEARAAAAGLEDRLYRTQRLARHAVTAFAADEIDRLWELREGALPSLYGLRGGAQPVPFVEDVGVPVEELPGFLYQVQELFQQHETTASYLIHAGTGQVHTRPFLDLGRPEDVAKLSAIAERVHTLALNLGGTVSTQHGTGLARTPWVARQYGALYPVLREIKAIFDPRGIFNPGKIIGPDPGLPVWPLRIVPPACQAGNNLVLDVPPPEGSPEQPLPRFDTHLRWQVEDVCAECLSCNGCGNCRTEAVNQRMCPLFRATHAEAAAPRAKANLVRHALQEATDPRLLSSDDVRAVADLCVNCKMCLRECPAHVNIPKLMLEAKASHVAEHGLDRTEWVLARTESFARLGSAFALAVNYALASGTARWVLEKLFGISRKRRLPTFAGRSFLRQARQHSWTRRPRTRGPKVAYFVDVFANYNDPSIGEAVVGVLHHNGVEVYVPPAQRGCGMAALAYGDADTARETAQWNLRILANLAREGYPIVCSEPTAAYMLRHDYLDLVDDPDARIVADRTVELTTYLEGLRQRGQLRTDFQRLKISVGHHVPCHLKALGQPPAGPGLLALIPGLNVHTIDVSCSGMAGTFGLKAENYAVSLEAGRPMLDELARPAFRYGSTECSTCRLQMEDGTGKRTLHPAQYLALAYGLLPVLAQRLAEPVGELVLR
jgi:FAD/FMN-containing dehydrogenase/Fe-S oxidoreductase